MSSSLEKILATARSEYFSKKGKYKNPYPINSPEFNEYERGWMQSLKADGGKLVDLDGKSSQARSNPAVNQYAKRRG